MPGGYDFLFLAHLAGDGTHLHSCFMVDGPADSVKEVHEHHALSPEDAVSLGMELFLHDQDVLFLVH